MSTYLIFAIVPFFFCLYAQFKIQRAYKKYSQIRTQTGVTGYEAARKMLNAHNLYDVKIECVKGTLSDHYDPRTKVLRLSNDVYYGNSIASVGVACHESGHAYQDAEAYGPLKLRSAMVPAVNFGGTIGPLIFMIGLLLAGMNDIGLRIAEIGLIIFSLTAIFSIVTLPVEYNASNRAKEWLATSGLMYQNELDGVSSILSAAALTYVSAAIQSLANVLYYASIFGSRRNKSRRR